MKTNGIYVNYRKWPDTLHWHFTVYPLGNDVHGAWFCLPDGAVVQKGSGTPQTSRTSIMLLPVHSRWVASWNTDKTKPHELYIDVIKLINADSSEIAMIDLDLDVARTWEGQVEILDREEFELHRKVLQYPKDVVEQAEGTAELLAKLVRNREEPFGVVGDTWRANLVSRGTGKLGTDTN
jgi:hypothetical protein